MFSDTLKYSAFNNIKICFLHPLFSKFFVVVVCGNHNPPLSKVLYLLLNSYNPCPLELNEFNPNLINSFMTSI